jgi:hypothetical protein
MKKITILILLLAPLAAWSQDKAVKKKISLNLTEQFHVLNSDDKVRQGLYMVTDQEGGAVVRGKYDAGKKVGTWFFYGPENKLAQQYDYNSNKLLYTDLDTGSYIKTDYKVDAPKDAEITPPVKIGGATLAFLSFYNSKDVPAVVLKEKSDIKVTYTVNITETGQIDNVYAEYESAGVGDKRKLNLRSNSFGLLDFIPAKVNGKPVKSSMMLSTTIQLDKVNVNYYNMMTSSQKN